MPHRRIERQIERIENLLGLPQPRAVIHRCIGSATYLIARGLEVPPTNGPHIYWVVSFGEEFETLGLCIADALDAAEERAHKKYRHSRHKP